MTFSNRRRSTLAALVLAALVFAGLATAPPPTGVALGSTIPPAPRPASATREVPVRGMTVSTPTAGREWGTDTMVETMETLRDLGVNWIQIHPYGGLRNDGRVGGARIDGMYRDTTWLTRPIAEAKRLGLKIFIKPHLAYWGTRFSWRGDIQFETEDEWERFFRTYEEWILEVAELSAGADAFAVGTELDQTIAGHEAEWDRIIAGVRERFDAPLTYSAGWDSYRSVTFWDDLDAVGIQAYFPVVEHEERPSAAEIEEGWQRVVADLDAYSAELGKPIVFGELGYNRSLEAAVRPWAYQQHRDAEAERLQVELLDAALRAMATSESIVGAFLWKWFPGEVSRGNFIKSSPAMREVIRAHWGS